MKTTCTECGISYSAAMDACPWCGHVRLVDSEDAPSSKDSSGGNAPTSKLGDAEPEVHLAEPPVAKPPDPTRQRSPAEGPGEREAAPPEAPPEESEPAEQVATKALEASTDPGDADSPTMDVLTNEARDVVRPTRVERREMTELLSDTPRPAAPPPTPSPPPPTSPRWKKRITTVGIAAALIVLGALVAEFFPLNGASDSTTAGAAAPATEPPATSQTTTAPQTTQPGSTATTQPAVIDPVDGAIAIDELDLAADSLGPLEFGITGAEAVGRLVASFGQPDEDSGVVTGEPSLGICTSEQMRTLRWGGLTAVLKASNGVETFAGYRLSLAEAGGHSTAGITTLSGLSLGDTVETLQQLYSGLRVELIERDGTPAFELYGSSDGLLLWGQLTSTDTAGTVETIQSPLECAG